MHVMGSETSTSIRGGGARILTVKRRLENHGEFGKEGEDGKKEESSTKKREATTSNQAAVKRIKKTRGPVVCDENENLDNFGEVEDEDVVEVEETWGQAEEDKQ